MGRVRGRAGEGEGAGNRSHNRAVVIYGCRRLTNARIRQKTPRCWHSSSSLADARSCYSIRLEPSRERWYG